MLTDPSITSTILLKPELILEIPILILVTIVSLIALYLLIKRFYEILLPKSLKARILCSLFAIGLSCAILIPLGFTWSAI
jgi:hypothetical protein